MDTTEIVAMTCAIVHIAVEMKGALRDLCSCGLEEAVVLMKLIDIVRNRKQTPANKSCLRSFERDGNWVLPVRIKNYRFTGVLSLLKTC